MLCVLGLACAPALLVGCESGERAEERVALLEVENQELRERERQLQDALSATEGQMTTAELEAQQLAAENERLRGELSDARSTPARPATTGFENIPGATTSLRGSDIVVDVAGDVLFASGSVTLKQASKQTLNRIASVLNSQYPGFQIEIAGHTDTDPIRKSKWETNERLSAERALAVEQYLASRGVNSGRMHIAGYGPDDPRSTKQASRRVEIIVLGQ